MKILRSFIVAFVAVIALMCFVPPALAFCGFYVAKADSSLYNQASQVIIARDGERTILTMANDYKGEAKDFALVVPVPVPITKDQVHVSDPKVIQRLDNFSAPRLVEYFDSNPCIMLDEDAFSTTTKLNGEMLFSGGDRRNANLGVTVEARFTVGEYDILILSAKESDGLETWLVQNGYKIPPGASQLLQPYIRDNMKFFVAKVNLEEFQKSDFQSLRPLAIAYESPRFMLPIRLGTVNGQGEQDLIVYVLSPQGQVELTNYRSAKIPSDAEIPEFVKEEFAEFYKAMYQTAHERENKKVAFLEYAWDMAWCDPCAAEPLTPEELKEAGVFWLNSSQPNSGGGQNVFMTRLHVRYNRNTFPEDLRFQQTGNRENFQGRYIIRHPYKGEMDCPAAENYQQGLQERLEKEATTLASLTRWNVNEIRRKIEFPKVDSRPWWRRIWN
ncbi:DUF2330 domain-containing protein [Oscillatoria sp. FACHB-1406]|uniref:DUF2330 domain-containing protein n=1 Tax=Oscillatoria sp. FACHB-1406 TaxID=2692846 RepID=UPI00168931B9|nr:DUF2330 domain-containing protein [Oscillatoria sp. FACHB-1406]MBD2578270.1 DUF2330 domain-containing protein [Oscillatoria sp. FACHB-1406]